MKVTIRFKQKTWNTPAVIKILTPGPDPNSTYLSETAYLFDRKPTDKQVVYASQMIAEAIKAYDSLLGRTTVVLEIR